tara:strand:- start:703 stop:1047 length:345 start_codon:yes stop_codon:yes gene_type:complete
MLISERKLRKTIRSVLLENYEVTFKSVDQFVDLIQNALNTVSRYGRGEYEMMIALLMLFKDSSYSFVDLERFNEDLQNKNQDLLDHLSNIVHSTDPGHIKLIDDVYSKIDTALD